MAAEDESGLNLVWSFGFSSWISNSVHDLHPARPNCLVAASGIHVVIYNYVSGQQQLLVGHTSAIGCLVTSHDRSIIITGESQNREDGLVIVWESRSGLPLATRNLAQGVLGICVNPSNTTAALLTNPDDNGVQRVLLWSLVDNTIHEVKLTAAKYPRFHICWNPSSDDLCVTNQDSVVFLYLNRDHRDALHPQSTHHCMLPNSGHSGSRGFGRLKQSVHVPNRNEVLSGSDTGTIIVWAQHFSESHRTFMKAVPLYSATPIIFIDVIHDLVAVATKDQALRFLDLQFRIVFWFEDFAYGPINSLSFLWSAPGATIVQAGIPIKIPEFIFATTQANVVKITAKTIQAMPNPSSPRGFLLVKGFGDTITCMVTHPVEPLVAIGTQSGSFQLIDYLDRTIQFAKQFPSGSQITAMAFSNKAEARSLALALFSESFNQIQICSLPNRLAVSDQFEVSRGTMHLLSISSCDSYMAMASSEKVPGGQEQRHFIFLYEKSRADQKWSYIGRAQPHSQHIIQIEFDRFHLQLYRCSRLLLLSMDQTIGIIDLPNSNINAGIRVARTTLLRFDSTGQPISMYTQLQNSNFLLNISDSCGKVRSFVERQSDGEWICVRTGSAPINDDCVSQRLIPLSSSTEIIAYSSSERFLGLMSAPATFNQSTAVIGHSGAIDQVLAGFDGKTLLSCDSQQQCVHLWRLDMNKFHSTLSSESITYLAEDLDRVRHVISYMVVRKGKHGDGVQGDALLKDQVVEVLNAFGCYLSQQHTQDIVNELKWSSDPTQTALDNQHQILDGLISLHEFMGLWLNHRPIRPDPDVNAVWKAFQILGANSSGEISLQNLLSKLERHGERLTKDEFERCRQIINAAIPRLSLQSTITPSIFIEQILNFEKSPTA